MMDHIYIQVTYNIPTPKQIVLHIHINSVIAPIRTNSYVLSRKTI